MKFLAFFKVWSICYVTVLVNVLFSYQLVRTDIAGLYFVNHADIDFIETILALSSNYWFECCHNLSFKICL